GLYWGLFDEDLTHFAQAVYRGKLLQYAVFPQHTQPYGTVELYFHTYNPLGDPELNIWRGTPEFMNAAYPQNISVSSNYIMFNVFNEGNQPIADAHVCALKELGGEDEIFTVGKTDESGFILLPLNGNPSQGDMYITITHNDYLPIIDTITVNQPSVALGYNAHTIDDDNNGYSHGNGDNIANPSEYIEVALTISNRGEQPAEDVIGNLTIEDPYGKVLSGANTFGTIQPAGSATANFVIMVSPDCPDGYSLPFELSLNYSGGDEMTTLMEVDVSSPGLMVSSVNIDDYGGNSNGILDPGETASVVIDLLNNGGGDAFAVNCVVDSDDAYIQLLDVEGEFGNIHVGETGSNVETPFLITADDDAFEGRTCHFTLRTVNEYGTGFDVPFAIELGSRTEDDPVGPDNYGYYIYDELDAGYSEMPSYDWVDIGDTGTRVAAADDRSDLVNLPFDFNYYGETYNAIIISSNGFVAVDTAAYDMGGNRWALFFNWPQPDPNGPGGQISPFWDDLDGSAYGGQVVYEYDSPNNRFIVQWDNVRAKWGSYYETFEMIIYDAGFYRTATGDCPILFQYNDVYDGDYDENYCTVGFESFDEFDGLQYAFCHEYSPGAAAIDDGRALLISPNTGRGRIYGNATLAGNPDNSGIKITTSTGQKGYTNGSGAYTVVDAEVGPVDMAFSKVGYLTQLISGVNVISNDRTDAQTVELQMAPVPQNLDASENAGDYIDITWEEASPNAVGYNLYRSEYENGLFVKLNDEPITGLSYTDSDVTAEETYWYYATAIYEYSTSFASNKDAGSTGMVGLDDDESNLPTKLALSQNYPNPFNASTTIKYALPSDGNVKLEVFNLMGQRVETLIDDYQQAGYKSLTWNFGDKASGIYFYRLSADGKSMVKRMTILK
ncbi:MAG: T9SS type A sorting domain-containing protein, partial [candidate division Zixibacteria bacterium]|nr:T9SS type A sorting domain-containing protein [candidate division Zixibacteria bacterium]